MERKEKIINALRAFVAQRPGLEYGNYGEPTSYRAECRSIARDLREARRLIRGVELSSLDADALIAAARSAYSGRLSIVERPNGTVAIDYCTGQYWPTEYRRAVCAVCASALWDYYRDDFAASAKPGESAGDAVRRNFLRKFGRDMASRWFD